MAVSSSLLRALSGLVLAVLLSGCDMDAEQAIVGKWQEIDGPEVVEFDAEGNVVLQFEDMALEGRYEFLATDRILLDLRGPRVTSDPIEAPVRIEDDVLTFTMPDGRVATYGRAN